MENWKNLGSSTKYFLLFFALLIATLFEMWFLLSILSAVVYSFRGIIEKKLLTKVDKYILGFAIRLFALPFLTIPFIIDWNLTRPILNANFDFWFSVLFVSFICTPTETYFYYRALKDEELTTALPILSLGPMLTLLMGNFWLREIPSLFGLFGVLLITIGIYSLKIHHAREGLLEPIKHLGRNKAIQFMFVVMIFQSIGAIFDKVGVSNTSAYVYSFFNYLFFCFSIGLLVIIKAKKHLRQLIIHAKSFLLIGFVVATYTLLYVKALETGFAAYVSAIKNTYILFSIILGIILLREKEGRQKLFAGFIIVIGLALVKIFS